MSKLIVLSGVPGSGKSYLANLLKKMKQSHIYIVSSDDLRSMILGNQQDLSQDKLMWQMFYEMPKVYSLDKQAIVLLDACHATPEIRTQSIKDLIPLFDEVSLVMFKLDKDLVANQNIRREFPVPTSVLENFYNYFKDIYKLKKEIEGKINKSVYKVIPDFIDKAMLFDYNGEI